MKCRNCKKKLKNDLIDLGFSPVANRLISSQNLFNYEKHYPLKVFICSSCWFGQTYDLIPPEEIFEDDYPYFSSMSSFYLDHAKKFVDRMKKKLMLNKKSFVIEIASNDGYLLKNFKKYNIKNLGIEPTKSTAGVSKKHKIKTIQKFFSFKLSQKIKKKSMADLIVANNVFAHVPNIHDFMKGMKNLLKKNGTITIEVQHLLNIIKYNQFDTIYHEHFSYYTVFSFNKIAKNFNLKVWDVEKIPTHGGSIRIYLTHMNNKIQISKNVTKIINEEKNFGLFNIKKYKLFQINSGKIKNNFLTFLIDMKNKNKVVYGYGAAAKGNTFINYAGIKNDMLKYVFDAAKSKAGKSLPGSHIPILHMNKLKNKVPDYLIIFPWNIKNEIINNFKHLKTKQGNKIKFVTFVPSLKIN